MRTNFFCTNFLNTLKGPGHPGKLPGTSQIPLFEIQGRQTFEGGRELFGHHAFAWKIPTPPGGLQTRKVNLCALFSCLILPRFGSQTALQKVLRSVLRRCPGGGGFEGQEGFSEGCSEGVLRRGRCYEGLLESTTNRRAP